MQNIKESKYYFSKNTLESIREENFHGLLNIKQNRFYMLSTNYSLTKLIQFLFLNYELFCVISFKNFNYDAHKKIDNNDCFEWGGSPQMHRGLQYDIDVNKPNMLMVPTQSPKNFFDIDLQEKMFFIMNTLIKIKTKIDNFKAEELDRINETIKGLEEFQNFSMIISPNDKNISNFVNYEIESKKANLLFLDEFWQELIKLLYEFDLKNKDIPVILEQITELIRNFFYKTTHTNTIKALKNEIYETFNIKI